MDLLLGYTHACRHRFDTSSGGWTTRASFLAFGTLVPRQHHLCRVYRGASVNYASQSSHEHSAWCSDAGTNGRTSLASSSGRLVAFEPWAKADDPEGGRQMAWL